MDVTLPSGVTLKNLPEGITREEIIAKLEKAGHDPVKLGLMTREQQQYAEAGKKLAEQGGLKLGPGTFPEAYRQELASRNPLEKFNAGFGILPTQVYMGGGHVGQGETPRDVQQIQAYKQLGSTLPGALGNIGANMAVMGPAYGAMAGPGAAGTMAGRIGMAGLLGGSQGFMTSPGERASGTAVGAGASMVGAAAGEGLNAVLQSRYAASQQLKQANALRDQVTREAHAAGFKIPPAESNPTLANRSISGLAGKQTIPQMSSTANDKIVQRLAAKAVDIPVVSPANVMAAEKEAGKAYEALRNYGKFTADDEFVRNVSRIGEENVQTGQILPSTTNADIVKLLDTPIKLGGAELNSNATISVIKRLRSQSNRNFSSNDSLKVELASAQRAMADELEGLIGRNLAASGKEDLLTTFQSARVRLAKLGVIDAAMNEATGKVNPLIIGKQLQNKEPLSGQLLTIGKVALTYPSALQQNTKGNIGLPFGMMNYALGLLGGAAGGLGTGGPLGAVGGAGLALAPPVVGAGMLAGQRFIGVPSYLVRPNMGAVTTPAATALGLGQR